MLYSIKKIGISMAFFCIQLFLFLIYSPQVMADGKVISDINPQIITQQLEELATRSTLFKMNSIQKYQLTHEIEQLQKIMNNCIKNGHEKIKMINILIDETKTSEAFQKDKEHRLYLEKEKSDILTQTAYCNFFSYRLNDTMLQAKGIVPNDYIPYLLRTSATLAEIYSSNPINNISFSRDIFYQESGINYLTLENFVTIGLILFIGLFSALFLFFGSPQWISRALPNEYLAGLIKVDAPIIGALFFIGLYVQTKMPHVRPVPIVPALIEVLVAYLLLLFIIRVCFNMRMRGGEWAKLYYAYNFLIIISTYALLWYVNYQSISQGFFSPELFDLRHTVVAFCFIGLIIATIIKGKDWISAEMADDFLRYLTILATVVLFDYVVYIGLQGQNIPQEFYDLLQLIIAIIINILFLCLINTFFKALYIQYLVPIPLLSKIKFSIRVLIISLIVLSCFGYIKLSLHFIEDLILSIIILIIFWQVNYFLKLIYNLLSDPKNRLSLNFRMLIGLKTKHKLVELFVIRVIAHIALTFIAFIALAEIWGATSYQISALVVSVRQGLPFLGTVIHIPILLRSANVFCISVLCGRMITAYIVRNHMNKDDKHALVMMSSLLNYLVFILSFIIGLYALEVNLSSIIVVTGALFVGLGIGLKTFAENLISGFLVIFHKQIKIGDHVIIENIEGFIKKIGAITTQLTTLSHSYVFIPNSYFVTKTVTNLTLNNNKLCRIKTQITMLDNHNIKLGKQILLDVAKSIPRIIQEPPDQPVVIYQYNCLELWCVIRDIDSVPLAISEINFAINHAFNEQNIEITMKVDSMHQ